MKINTAMPKSLNPFSTKNWKTLKRISRISTLQKAGIIWNERTSIGQPYPREHTLVHWKMLRFSIQIKNTREIFGQIPRLLVGGVKSFVGEIPMGNTRSANVPPLKPMGKAHS